jgi:diguanylate cyclase (GGDEF)-like protein
MFIDLDNFKYVNDSLGHEMGDDLLLAVTDRIKSLIADFDILSRLGGDEFTIIIQDYQDLQDVEILAQNIITSLKKAFVIQNKEIFIGSSIGISLFPENSDNYKELIKFADTAMYYVKNHGKNSYVFFNTKMTEFSNERLTIETNLRKSIENGEFRLMYQPKVNISTNTTLSVEALIRFENSVLKEKALPKCIDIAEDTGLIIPITYWIIETACVQLKKWKDEGYGFLRIAVNISTKMFRDDELVYAIDKLLQKYDLEPKNLEIEITETTIMDYLEKSIEVLQKLANMGIKIAIDDFGTGYSSMSYLKTLPIDYIKIDKSFINEIHTKKGKAIVTAIIAMAKSLNIKVIAEGVEDIFQLELLKQKGCDIVQGYYYSKPLTHDDFLECIIKQDELNKEIDNIHTKVVDILNSKKLDTSKDVSIVKFSISGFSLVGREYGFEKENSILESISSIVRNNIRCEDIYSRTCSEEFFVVVQADQNIATILANRIKDAIKDYDFGIVWKLSPSFFILEVNENDTKESIIERIDKPVCKF